MSDSQVSFPSSDIPHPDDSVWLKILVENSPHGIFALNESRQFIYINPFVCKLLGFSCEELLGSSLFPHVAPESLKLVRECLEICSTGEADPKRCECTLLCRQDERKIVQIAITPGHDGAGRAVILGNLIDMTEKKTAVRKLDVFRQIVATSGNSITFMDRDHRYQIVNQAFLDLHQLEEKDVIGRCVGDLLGPDIYTKIKDHHQQCLSGQHLHIQDWFNFPNVGRKFLDVQYHPHREADGTVSGVVTIVADQTVQETNRQNLVRERQRLDDVLTGTRAGTWEWNVETGETLFNERWAEIIGYSLDELSPTTMKTWIQFVHPEDLQESSELLEKHFNGKLDYYDFECRMRHKQGHWVWINDRGKVLSWSDEGRPLLMYGTHIDITARKEAEAMNVQFSRAIDQSFNEIYTFDCETLRFINVNAGARLNLGYSLTELRSMTPLDIKPEYTRENFTALVAPLRNGSQKKIIFTTHHRRKDGSCYPTEIQLQMIAGDNPVFLANVLDISERIVGEAALRQSEQKFRLIFDEANVGMALADAQSGEIVSYNEAFASMLGYSATEMIGQPQAVLHPVTPERKFSDSFVQHRDVSAGKIIETQCLTKTGQRIDVDIKASLFDLDGRQMMLGIFNDITTKKRVELERERLQQAIDQSREAIVMTDKMGIIQYVNPAFTEITGYSSAEAIGQTSRVLKSGLQDKEFYQQLWDVLTSGQTWHGRLVNKKKDGSLYTELATISPVKDQQGKIINYVAVKRDITEEIEQEAQRHELEVQLRQKHKMEAVGYMAGGMAHNFNNNLSIILGNLELTLMKQPPGSEVINFLENAKIAVRRSRDLVQSLMTYSRKGVQQKSATRLTTIIDETIHLIQVTIPSTVLLKKHYAAGCEARRIHADPSQIQEVLINLCNNAVQAMDEKGELTILLEPVTIRPRDIPIQYDCLPGNYAKLSVQDSGCGMDEETLEHIFDPFFSSKEAYEGAGMGLATVQGIVAQHGGMIKVSSRLNQGTTFDLYFPFVAEIDGDERVPQDDELHGGHEQILYVDDDPVLIELGKELLGEMGYGVSVMNDGEDALKMFSADAERFDLVITDQTMPGLTGEELIHRIKAIRSDIPTILCTGYSSKMDEAKAEELGISAFMMKPVESSRLLQTIRKVLDERKAR
ncbi:MAG: PAS domain S-box protein [Desulfuromonadales bacterium]|nr:PAS domain S-box protein [Desulfuromonadales bacterium]MBN2793303.1 PAS domain S-box protein [Desulfuromonadales bacterium]